MSDVAGKGEITLAPPGHPINTLMEEHKLLLGFAAELRTTVQVMRSAKDFGSSHREMEQLKHIVEHLKDSESHYLREENVLFPYLERHGITQPPAIMWSEHNEIRERKKRIYGIMEKQKDLGFQKFVSELEGGAASLDDLLQSHFYKENNMLFPMAIKVITEDEWAEVGRQFDELGYCCFTPQHGRQAGQERRADKAEPVPEGQMAFETGSFSREELETLLNTLPVDITFVDKDDKVRYFSQSKERIFARTKAVIGREVLQCHPKESLDRVVQIVNDFKSNKRNSAEFWINLKGRLVYIRYFPVRRNGEYLGTLEVTQDITDIKKIEGEKRLL
ncbi:MAG: PAS domain-containing protein [Candidatus Eisenbacteria bacterium]|nr:PAS domain-containing protein [Candidatus Eisenbacteria bacterium]